MSNEEWAKLSFEDFLKKRVNAYVFRVEGTDRKGKTIQKDMTTTFGRMFSRLLTRLEILNDLETGKARTLYSLRHMYATFALTYNRMSIYTLAEHMGTSVTMIQNHYNHIILRKAASRIAGDRGWREREV